MTLPTPDLDLGLPVTDLPLADRPPEARGLPRDGVRLLVTDVDRHRDARFRNLAELLRPGDLLALNRSRTLPSSVPAQIGHRRLRLHLVRVAPNTWLAEPRSPDGREPWAAPLEPGERVVFADGTTAAIGERYHPALRLWRVALGRGDARRLMAATGAPIRYGYVRQDLSLAAYQTVFAKNPGSAEMPSAGRPFTRAVFASLAARGVEVAFLTLHTGLSSHEVEGDFDDHPLLPEAYAVPPTTLAAIARARALGGRVIAVGTTVVRALAAAANGGSRGWATAVVRPGRRPALVDGLLTGLHAPRASHLALLEAFLPPAVLREAYGHALRSGYLWHEFGDLHLILPVPPGGRRDDSPPCPTGRFC